VPQGSPGAAVPDVRGLADLVAKRLGVHETLATIAGFLRPAPHQDLRVAVDEGQDAVRRLRDELGAWLAGLGASSMNQISLVHAAAELLSNALEHGSHGSDRRVEVRARLGSDGVVRIEVLDHGTWQPPSDDPGRGRGLAMAAGLVDHLGVAVRPTGTRAFLQHRLTRAMLIETVAPAERPAAPRAGVEVVRLAPQVIALRGIFQHDDVERVSAEIMVATRGGTTRLSLDLTDVDHLSTSAVRMLADLTSVNRAVGMYTAEIHIISAADSTTQRSLEMARVPHHAA